MVPHLRPPLCPLQVRSTTLDTKVWEQPVVALFQQLGNAFATGVWEGGGAPGGAPGGSPPATAQVGGNLFPRQPLRLLGLCASTGAAPEALLPAWVDTLDTQ